MTYRYPNKRLVKRVGGRFARTTMEDVGIGGSCPVCHHFLLRSYDGPVNDPNPNPQLFRYRCFTCEPMEEKP